MNLLVTFLVSFTVSFVVINVSILTGGALIRATRRRRARRVAKVVAELVLRYPHGGVLQIKGRVSQAEADRIRQAFAAASFQVPLREVIEERRRQLWAELAARGEREMNDALRAPCVRTAAFPFCGDSLLSDPLPTEEPDAPTSGGTAPAA